MARGSAVVSSAGSDCNPWRVRSHRTDGTAARREAAGELAGGNGASYHAQAVAADVATALGIRPRKSLGRRIVEHRTLFLLFIPVLVYYVLLRYWPISLAWIIAFKDLKLGLGIVNSPWVGLQNFREIFSDPDILRVIRNSVEISVLRIVVGFAPPIILAIMFHDMVLPWFKKTTQTIVYIPHFFSWVVIWGMVFAVFSTGTGLINNLIEWLGFERVEFLLSKRWFRPILIGSALWKELGWGTILYLAALATVDPQLYEAAVLDGAGPLKRIRYVTLPSILPVVTFVLCINLGHLLAGRLRAGAAVLQLGGVRGGGHHRDLDLPRGPVAPAVQHRHRHGTVPVVHRHDPDSRLQLPGQALHRPGHLVGRPACGTGAAPRSPTRW